MPASPQPVRSRLRSRRQPARMSLLGVLGELLVTGGVLVLMFLAWQLWLNDAILRSAQDREAAQLSESWRAAVEDRTTPSENAIEPALLAAPVEAEVFGVLRIPRFGADYAARLAGGVSTSRTLNPLGLGHYPETQMPGELGNFAVAGHRNTHGKPLNLIGELRVGDAIVVEVPDGWYTYRFRTLEYVAPSGVGVLNPVPQEDGVKASDAIITLTSCNPAFSTAERIIAYGAFESWTPRGAGLPASLTDPVED